MAGFRGEQSTPSDDDSVDVGGESYSKEEIPKAKARLKKEMLAAAEDLDFEKAAELRDSAPGPRGRRAPVRLATKRDTRREPRRRGGGGRRP